MTRLVAILLAWCSLLLGLACSDQNFRSSNQPPVELPLIQVTPPSVSTLGFCGQDELTIVVSNIGRGNLELGHFELIGDGWVVGEVDLPATVAVGESLTIPLTTTGGEATLKIISNDPSNDEIYVPLVGVANLGPTVNILAPYDGAVVDEGLNTLESRVADGEDADNTLAMIWSAEPGGVIWEGVPDSEATSAGAANSVASWQAGPEEGSQELTLTATDSCGVATSETIGICRGHITTFQSVDSSTWEFMGSASWVVDEVEGSPTFGEEWLELTNALDNAQVGAAFETAQVVPGGDVEIEFAFFIGNSPPGTGADGFSLTALDTTRMDTDNDGQPNYLGGAGCAMGFGGNSNCTTALSDCTICGSALPGWSLEVDTYWNPEEGIDPTGEDHLGFYFDGDLQNMAEWAVLPEMEDTGWHIMNVTVNAPRVTVAIDDVTYMDADLIGFFDFPAYVGFTAGTGGETNAHLIKALTVTESTCD